MDTGQHVLPRPVLTATAQGGCGHLTVQGAGEIRIAKWLEKVAGCSAQGTVSSSGSDVSDWSGHVDISPE